MAINVDGAFSRGDVMRRLAALEQQVAAASRLQPASVGRALAGRLADQQALDAVSTSGTSWVERSGGPVVEVTISAAGRAVVWLGADVVVDTGESAYAAIAVSGASVRPAPAGTGGWLSVDNDSGGALTLSASKVITFSGLNPGLTQFTARYRSGSTATVGFAFRSLAVLAL